MRNWLFLAVSTPAFLAATLIGWSGASWIQKTIVIGVSIAAVVATRIVLARQLSFQYLLFARASIWILAFVAITSAMITLFSAQLPRAGTAAVLFVGVFGVFATSLMMFLAIGKPCPACDGRSPIQFVKGPQLWVGPSSLELKVWQSGVANRCPICEADWSFTEAELREARARRDSSTA